MSCSTYHQHKSYQDNNAIVSSVGMSEVMEVDDSDSDEEVDNTGGFLAEDTGSRTDISSIAGTEVGPQTATDLEVCMMIF